MAPQMAAEPSIPPSEAPITTVNHPRSEPPQGTPLYVADVPGNQLTRPIDVPSDLPVGCEAVLNIMVDREGNVRSAKIDRARTICPSAYQERLVMIAKTMKFQKRPKARSVEPGTVTFRFMP